MSATAVISPKMSLRAYAVRWLRKHSYDVELFLKHVGYVDPTCPPETARKALKDALCKAPAHLELPLDYPDDGRGTAPETFSTQQPLPEGSGFESGQVVPVIQFDYNAVFADVDGEADQRQHLVSLLEMLLWLDEPLPAEVSACPSPNLATYKRKLLQLILSPASLGCPSSSQLSRRLGVSRQFMGKILRDFKTRYPTVSTSWMKTDDACELLREAHQPGGAA
jgi:hypothetical protein